MYLQGELFRQSSKNVFALKRDGAREVVNSDVLQQLRLRAMALDSCSGGGALSASIPHGATERIIHHITLLATTP